MPRLASTRRAKPESPTENIRRRVLHAGPYRTTQKRNSTQPRTEPLQWPYRAEGVSTEPIPPDGAWFVRFTRGIGSESTSFRNEVKYLPGSTHPLLETFRRRRNLVVVTHIPFHRARSTLLNTPIRLNSANQWLAIERIRCPNGYPFEGAEEGAQTGF